MEKKKLDWIISIIREEMTVGTGGYTGSGDQTRAGFDPVMPKTPVKRYAKGGYKSRKPWLDFLKNK